MPQNVQQYLRSHHQNLHAHTHMPTHQQQQHHLLFLTCIPGSFSDSPARAMEEDDDDSANPIIKKGLVRK
jgi:hypothetical protein